MSKLSQTAYEQLRGLIISGEITVDTHISEASLARLLGVSRTPVREAIHRLKTEGLLEQRPRSGTFVRGPSRAQIRHALEVRILVEPLAAARAARKCRPECLKEMTTLYAEMQEAVRGLERETRPERKIALSRRFLDYDRRFHEAYHREIDNPRLFQALSAAHIVTLGLVYLRDWPDKFMDMPRMSQQGHEQTLQAIRAGEPAAARKVVRQLALGARRLAMSYFDWLDSQSTAHAP